MSISDAYVRVVCNECGYEEEVELPYIYHSYSGESGQYDDQPNTIHRQLEDSDWIIVSDEEHYCSQECYEDAHVDEIEEDKRAGIDKYGYDTLEEKYEGRIE